MQQPEVQLPSVSSFPCCTASALPHGVARGLSATTQNTGGCPNPVQRFPTTPVKVFEVFMLQISQRPKYLLCIEKHQCSEQGGRGVSS